MAITPRGLAIASGSLLGAYTSDITENPLSGLLTTGIGASMGAFMSLPQADLKSLGKVAVGPKIDLLDINLRSELGISQADERFLNNFRGDLNNFRSRLDRASTRLQKSRDNYEVQKRKLLARKEGTLDTNIKTLLDLKIQRLDDRYNQLVEKRTESISKLSSRLNPVKEILNQTGFYLNNSSSDTELLDFLSNNDNTKLLKKLSPYLTGNKEVVSVDINKTGAPVLQSKPTVISKNDFPALKKWFEGRLGNNPIEAEAKAKMFLNRIGGDTFILKDGAISFEDIADGKRVTVPLTSYSGDTPFHYAGNGNYQTVERFNPYGIDYLRGKEVNIDGTFRKVTAQDMLKGYDPEMMISHLDQNTPISKVLDKMKSLFHYDSKETGINEVHLGGGFKPTSEKFTNSTGIVNFQNVFNYDQRDQLRTDTPFRKISAESPEAHIMSERSALFNKLGLELSDGAAGHLFDNVSMNSLYSYQTKGYDSFALFAPNERNETGVGNRGVDVVTKNKNTQIIESVVGSEAFNRQFSSSQVIKKLDIVDDKGFNFLMSSVYGNDKILADGSGLFNMGLSEDFKIKDKSILKIPLTNVAVENKELATALASDNVDEYLKRSPIAIDNNPLAYDSSGREISLNKMYSEGTITSAFKTDTHLQLQVDSIFDPKTEQNVKFFSTGSKSLNTGLDERQMTVAAEIGLMLNSGELSVSGEKIRYLNKELTKEQFENFMLNRTKDKRTDVGLIGRASDTGMSPIMEMLRSEKPLVNMNLDTSGFNYLKSIGAENKASLLTSYLLTETKANVDLMATLAVNLNQPLEDAIAFSKKNNNILNIDTVMQKNLVSRGFLTESRNYTTEELVNIKNTLNTSFRDTFKSENFLNKDTRFLKSAYDLVNLSGTAEQLVSGNAFAVGSMNKGMSIVGAGNRARMSWNAIANLKASGFSNEDLRFFGNESKDLLYEVRSTIAERTTSASGVNRGIYGKEAAFISAMRETPEKRFNLIKGMVDDSLKLENNPFITYNLNYDKSDIKSLNFSRISTSRSGKYEDSGISLLKQLDNQKIAVMQADINLRDAKTVEDKLKYETQLQTKLKDYSDFTSKMYSGDNNLLKAAVSLESSHSDIMQVKGLGGTAASFADERLITHNENIWFLSKEGAESKAKELGVSLEFSNKDKTGALLEEGLLRPVYRKGTEEIPLASVITREPAQGPLSSDLVEWYVDKSLSGANNKANAYVSTNSLLYSLGMFGDMDQDTVQTLTGNFQTKAQFESLDQNRKQVRSIFKDMQSLTKEMKIKDAEKKTKTLGDFNDITEYFQYRMTSALKGRNRKLLAAPATGLAVAYSKAMELQFTGDQNSDILMRSRIASHQLVENLIKSAHLDTDLFGKESEQAIEILSRNRSGFIGKKGYEGVSSVQYEKVLRDQLPKFLGLDNITEPKNKTNLQSIIDNMVTAELSQSKKVGMNPFNPMDLAENRYSSNFIPALTNIAKESGIGETEFEEGLKHMRKASGQMYSGVSDLVLDTLKSNKMVFGGGLAAMAGVALLGRSQPNFSDSRSNVREHSASMLRAPESNYRNDVPMGMETNPNRAGYITPKTFNNKSARVSGDFIEEGYETYTGFTSMIDTGNIQEQAYNMTNAMFGSGLKSARLQTN